MFTKSKAATFKLALLASLVAAAAGMIAPSHAANSATATATAVVVTPIDITKAADLSFGKFASGATSGTVAVDTAGVASKTGGVILSGGTVTAAAFTVSGDKGAAYGIDTTGTSGNLTSGGNTMPFSLFTDVATGAGTSGTVTSGTIDGTTGTQTVRVGGSLNVGISQPAGTYTGSISVAVVYQ